MSGMGKVILTFKQRCSASYRIYGLVLLLKALKHWQFCKLSTQIRIYFYRHHPGSQLASVAALVFCGGVSFFDGALTHTCFHFFSFVFRVLTVGTFGVQVLTALPSLMSFSDLSCWVTLGTPDAVPSCGERGIWWQRLVFSCRPLLLFYICCSGHHSRSIHLLKPLI